MVRAKPARSTRASSRISSSSTMLSPVRPDSRSEEHTSELQSRGHLVCRLLLEKKKLNLETNPTNEKEDDARPAVVAPFLSRFYANKTTALHELAKPTVVMATGEPDTACRSPDA